MAQKKISNGRYEANYRDASRDKSVNNVSKEGSMEVHAIAFQALCRIENSKI